MGAMDKSKRTVVLTGASRGIGHATVKRFSSEKRHIITCSREDTPEHCKRDPNWTHHFPTDLIEQKSVQDFVDQARDVVGAGAIHALVNNAAVSPKTEFKERLGCLNGALENWREVFELNLFTPLMLARGFAVALARGAKSGDGAAIVNITSIPVTPSTRSPDRRIRRRRPRYRR